MRSPAPAPFHPTRPRGRLCPAGLRWPGAPLGRRGLTLPEVLVVLGIIGLLVGIIVPAVLRVRDASRRVTCLANLRQVGLGFRLYAKDEGVLPDPLMSEIPWDRMMQ